MLSRPLLSRRLLPSRRWAHSNSGAAFYVPDLPLFTRAITFGPRVAIVDGANKHTYDDLLQDSAMIARVLSPTDLNEERVAFLCPSGYSYAATQWAIWRAGGIAVPLCTSHPPSELQYVVKQSRASTLVAHETFKPALEPIARDAGIRLETLPPLPVGSARVLREHATLYNLDSNRGALIIYTSGTTGKPKGVLTTHANITAQVESMIGTWGWTHDDHILLCLPLHHVHGIVNVLTCGLWSGARVTMLPKFDPEVVWSHIASGKLTLFMAVPTVYAKLISTYDAKPKEERKRLSLAARKLRLMVSGSAALPESIMRRWEHITDHRLLERYGMTEIGMALTNPLKGERRPGSVGQPFPGVQARIVDPATGAEVPGGQQGELRIRGPSVFKEYWDNPQATAGTFDKDGWFMTGDTAMVEDGYYRILGRTSVDILKVGGYKISALDIERELLEHKDVAEAAVLGVDDPEYGQRIVAVVDTKGKPFTVDDAVKHLKPRVAAYKIPREVHTMTLPRNAMGKVNKKELVKMLPAGGKGHNAVPGKHG